MPIGNFSFCSQEREFFVANERFSGKSKREMCTADLQRVERRY
jgi:hypothetical protein